MIKTEHDYLRNFEVSSELEQLLRYAGSAIHQELILWLTNLDGAGRDVGYEYRRDETMYEIGVRLHNSGKWAELQEAKKIIGYQVNLLKP